MSHHEFLVPTLSWLKIYFISLNVLHSHKICCLISKHLIFSSFMHRFGFYTHDLEAPYSRRYPQMRGSEQEQIQEVRGLKQK